MRPRPFEQCRRGKSRKHIAGYRGSCRPYAFEMASDRDERRGILRRRGIKSRIARRGKVTSERLGRHRWVVERTLAWLARYRRLSVRYERRADIHEALLYLGCALVCLCCIKHDRKGSEKAAMALMPKSASFLGEPSARPSRRALKTRSCRLPLPPKS